MPHPCQYGCGCISDTPEERARHERCCPERAISCCQGVASCSRRIKDWVVAGDPPNLACCRHGSHGLFGAIKEDNIDLVQHFLSRLKSNLASVLTQESKFGDTILTYAASLGRTGVVEVLLKAIQSIVQTASDMLAQTDLVDFETGRGKSAVVEAAKSNQADAVAVLLVHHANAKCPSRVHHKSALDWAVALGHDTIAQLINEHARLEEYVHALFTAVSKFDVSAVKSLTEGGIPYERGQDAIFQRQLQSKRSALDLAKQNLEAVTQSQTEVDQSKEATCSEIQEREKHISCLEKKREEVESHRRNEVREVTAQVQHALTGAGDSQEAVTNPPLEYELICKALCTLLHIKTKISRCNTDDDSEVEPSMPHWKEIKGMLQYGSRFFHRIRHYHFEVDVVESAAKAEVDGLPGNCSDHLSSIIQAADHATGSHLMVALARWLWTMFQHVEAHKMEHSLLMEASDERDVLERSKIDLDVLTSRNAILKLERDDTEASIAACTSHISLLERKMEISQVMSFVVGGHSILSWAAGVGNEEIVNILLKRGAHTVVGDDCFDWCATIIQVAFRRHLLRRELCDIPPSRRHLQGANERRKQDLAFSLRMKSLSRLIRVRMKSRHLPLAEALFNGHPSVVLLLKNADIPPFQALNLFPMFHRPQGTLPRPPASKVEAAWPPCNGSDLLSHLIEAGQLYSHEPDPQNCSHANSLKHCIGLVEDFLQQSRRKVAEKISKRRDTIKQRFRNTKAAELASAILRGDFVAMVRASHEGNISLDYEDPTTGLTPLIRAAQEDIHSPIHDWCNNPVGENCTAVAYLLDRISPHRPSVDYENANGFSALAMACLNGRLEVIQDLIVRGADVNRLSTRLNRTAYDLAVEAKQLDVVEFLDRRKSKPK